MAWARAMTRSGRKGAEAIGYSNQLTVNSNQQLAAWRSLASHPGVCPLKPPSTVFGTFKFNYKVCLEGENPTQRCGVQNSPRNVEQGQEITLTLNKEKTRRKRRNTSTWQPYIPAHMRVRDQKHDANNMLIKTTSKQNATENNI